MIRKSARIDLRLTESELRTLRDAAEACGESLSGFVRGATMRAAMRILRTSPRSLTHRTRETSCSERPSPEGSEPKRSD